MAEVPDHLAVAFLAEFNSAVERGDLAQAEIGLREALQVVPGYALWHANLAWLLDQRGALDEALEHYGLAIDLEPDNAQIYRNLGAFLAEQKAHAAAEQAYRVALSLAPELPGIWSNLGALQAQTGRELEAETSLRHALTLDTSHPGAHFNLACLLLRQGHLEEGWLHLEARDWYARLAAQLDCPRWQGQSLVGQSILVGYEAGHGDMIQFSRYVRLLRDRGAARVDVLCHPALTVLLGGLDGVGRVSGFDAPVLRTGWDWWVPVLSLPYLFATRLESIPAQIPYLRAPDDRRVHWTAVLQHLSPSPALRIGLVWHGNPEFQNDSERSLPGLSTLAPLWSVPGVQFFSLQKGRGEQEVRTLAQEQAMVDVTHSFQDFADTAAVVEQLDLVISVDTAVAHLSAALGTPCWLLLPAYLTDWRWMHARTDSPWYPGVMRLFRQLPGQGWAPVVEQVRAALMAQPAGSA
jgi:Flp pilus assembly protein TadD